MHDPWTDRLSEYLDGELEAEEAARCEAHLGGCAECRAVLDELRRVVIRARELPDRPVPDRVWERVAAEIGAGPTARSAGGVRGRLGRTVRMPVAQLVAAGLAVTIVSGAVGWFVRPLPPATVAPAPAAAPPAETPHDAVALRPLDDDLWRDGGFEVAAVRWEEAVRHQEQVYRRHRAALDTTTVQVLERNLGLIDQSLAEIQEAKEKDPGNPLWNNRLVDGLRRKLRLLRWASSISTREI